MPATGTSVPRAWYAAGALLLEKPLFRGPETSTSCRKVAMISTCLLALSLLSAVSDGGGAPVVLENDHLFVEFSPKDGTKIGTTLGVIVDAL